MNPSSATFSPNDAIPRCVQQVPCECVVPKAFSCTLAMAAEAEAAGRVTHLEETLEAMAETLRHGIVILEDYKIENQESLWAKLCVRLYSCSFLSTHSPSTQQSTRDSV